jgi:CheY-like chemotaxis protein/signal transduction histidine kinase/HAMP domain-containing protein
MEIEHNIYDQVAQINVLIQKVRKNEKKFRLHLDNEYSQRAFTSINEIIDKSRGIKQFVSVRGAKGGVLAQKLAVYAADYGDILHKIVRGYEYKGLTPDSGLRGKFRAVAHRLFNQGTAEHAVGDLLAAIDLLRVSQRQLKQKDNNGNLNFKNAMANYERLLASHKLSNQKANNILDAFNDYKDAASLIRGGSRDGLKTMDESLDQMTAILAPLYVPNVRTLVLQIRRHEKDYLIRGDKQYVDLTHQAVANLLKEFRLSGIGGEHIADLKETLKAYSANFDELVAENRALTVLDDQLTIKYKAVQQVVTELDDLSHAQIMAAQRRSTSLTNRFSRLAIAICLVAVVVGIFLSLLITNSITHPLSLFMAAVKRMRDGDYTSRVNIESRDEIGRLGEMFNQMVSLIAHNAWQAKGRDLLAVELRGDKEEKDLCRDVLVALAKYVDAQVGTLYTAMADGSLSLTATYSFTRRKKINSIIEQGSGLVGEAALERQAILISEVPEDYIRIESSLGSAPPKSIVALPLIWQDKVLGVIELASFEEFSETRLAFLKDSANSIAIAINSSRQRDKNQALLEESQRQSEELQAQQEELQAANEEMEEKNKILEKSEDRLKTQQGELQAANEELEEKSEAILRQKEAVQNKNRDLEQARKEIEKKAAELASGSRYKSEFLANMSHELRSPLNSLLLLARNLSHNRDGNLNDSQLESVNIIHDSGQDLLNLINDILDLSKIEAGHMEVASEEVGLRGFADWLNDNFRHLAEDKGIYLKIEIDPDTPTPIVTDRQRFEQISRNLLTNALKFTEKGGITVRFSRPAAGIAASMDNLEAEHALVMTVSDTGIGIPEEKQALIFDAFKQADGSTSRQYGGTGLGLSIVRQLTELLGGEIRVSSVEGKGSEFVILLPVTRQKDGKMEDTDREKGSGTTMIVCEGDETQAEPVEMIRPAAATPEVPLSPIEDDRSNLTASDKVLLIVEDDVNFAKILMEQGRQKGFKCLTAVGGKEGLQLADRFKPGAIILDLRLPDINGWQVLESLKANAALRHIPVHMMSAEEKSIAYDRGRTADAMQKGAIGFLSKPVSDEDMLAAFGRLESALQGRLRNLLVVEDDKVSREQISALVGGKDVNLTMAVNGKDALLILAEQKIDCMVLDIGLPDMSGFDLLNQLRKSGREIPPVIVYTGRGLTRQEEEALRQYTDTVIIKGIKSEERLLDESALFLHRLMSDMPAEKRQMIASLYDQDTMFKDKRILVVDDDMRNAFALSQILEERGMKIQIADDGAKAVELLAEDKKFDLVLMDIMMPGMDGYEAMRRIRQDDELAQLPIITLTAKAMAEDKARCMEAGASDYLTKPVEEGRLLSMMRVWLYR